MRITRFGDPEALDVADPPEPEARAGRMLGRVAPAGVNYAGTHHAESGN